MKCGSCTSFRFGEFEVDAEARALRKHGIKIRLQEQPFQVLLMLLEARGEIVTREQFRPRLWPEGTFVEFDHALNTAVKKIRAALCDDPMAPRYIETIPRRGYRFIHPVETIDITPAISVHSDRWPFAVFHRYGPALIVATVTVALSFVTYRTFRRSGAHSGHHLNLVVLPLNGMSRSSGENLLSSNFSEVLSHQLQQVNPRHVVIINSRAQRAADSNEGEGKIEYVLEGGALQEGRHVHVVLQLLRMRDQKNLWAEDFDREWDGSANETELAADVVRHLQPTLALLAEGSR